MNLTYKAIGQAMLSLVVAFAALHISCKSALAVEVVSRRHKCFASSIQSIPPRITVYEGANAGFVGVSGVDTVIAAAAAPLRFVVQSEGAAEKHTRLEFGGSHVISMNFECTLTFLPEGYTCNGDLFLSKVGTVAGQVHFWGSATDGVRQNYNFNHADSAVLFRLRGDAEAAFSPETGALFYLFGERKDSWPGRRINQAYAFEYFSSQNTIRVWIALDSPFLYESGLEYFDFPASHIVLGKERAPSWLFGSALNAPGAAIHFGGIPQKADVTGQFHFETIPPGTYLLEITHPNFISYSKPETIPPFSIIKRSYELVATAPSISILDANPEFLEDILLPSRRLDSAMMQVLGRSSKERQSAVADGATTLLLRCQTPVPGKVLFSYIGPSGGHLLRVDGAPLDGRPEHTSLIGDRHMAFALFRVPEGIGLQQATANFGAVFAPNEKPEISRTAERSLKLCPTPILLLHGLWGQKYDWGDLKMDFWKYPVAVSLADYSAQSANSFAYNSAVVKREAERLLSDCRNHLGYAATQVDVVAHSMGGILTRIASNLPDYRTTRNFNAGYIRRVITVDTPHFGSPSASFLLHYLGSFSDPEDLAYRFNYIDGEGKYPYRGAVNDLDPYSFARSVGGFGGYACDPMDIPCHTIFCEATAGGDFDVIWETMLAHLWKWDFLSKSGSLGQRNPGLFDMAYTYVKKHKHYNGGQSLEATTGVVDLWRTVFSGANNDGTVGARSQGGGCAKSTLVDGVSHVRAPHDVRVRATIIRLLSDISEDCFASSGLPAVVQPNVQGEQGWYHEIRPYADLLRVRQIGPARDKVFAFSEPVNDTSVTAGQLMPFALEMADPQEWIEVNVYLKTADGACEVIGPISPPHVGKIEVPRNTVGIVKLTAIGRRRDGELGLSGVRLFARCPDGVQLISMQTQPTAITLAGVGESEAVRVVGDFDDGITRYISDISTGTRYSLGNTKLATVDGTGRVTARGPGETWLDVVNGTLSNRLALNITVLAPELLALWPSRLADASPTNLQLNVSGLCLGGASAFEVLRDGKPAAGLSITNINLNSSPNFLTVTLVVGKSAQPGRYKIVVTTPGGRSDAVHSKGAEFTINGPVLLQASHGPSNTLAVRVSDTLERAFVLETAQKIGSWSPWLTNSTVGGRWETNGITISGTRFLRARIRD